MSHIHFFAMQDGQKDRQLPAQCLSGQKKTVLIQPIHIAQFDTNGNLTVLYIFIKYIQMHYIHICMDRHEHSYHLHIQIYTYIHPRIYKYIDVLTSLPILIIMTWVQKFPGNVQFYSFLHALLILSQLQRHMGGKKSLHRSC